MDEGYKKGEGGGISVPENQLFHVRMLLDLCRAGLASKGRILIPWGSNGEQMRVLSRSCLQSKELLLCSYSLCLEPGLGLSQCSELSFLGLGKEGW